jgi:hypothetical protein
MRRLCIVRPTSLSLCLYIPDSPCTAYVISWFVVVCHVVCVYVCCVTTHLFLLSLCMCVPPLSLCLYVQTVVCVSCGLCLCVLCNNPPVSSLSLYVCASSLSLSLEKFHSPCRAAWYVLVNWQYIPRAEALCWMRPYQSSLICLG